MVQPPQAESPFAVVLVTHPGVANFPATLDYEVVEEKSGRVVAAVPSSYQPESGDDQWAAEQAREAEVYWNIAGDLLAIDESNHQFSGTVFVIELTHPQVLELTSRDIQPFFDKALERCRVIVERGGWVEGSRLSISVAGRLTSRSGPRIDFQREGFATVIHDRLKIRLNPPTSTGN